MKLSTTKFFIFIWTLKLLNCVLIIQRSIIFFNSTRASRGDVGISLYSTSKSILKPLSKCIAKELGRFNITSNVISLGYFDSPLLNNIDKKIKNKLLEQIPSKKIGKVRNISNMIKTIIKSDYVNAGEIKIDGGL